MTSSVMGLDASDPNKKITIGKQGVRQNSELLI